MAIDLFLDAAGAPSLRERPRASVPEKPPETPPAPVESSWRPDSQRRRDAVVDAARTLDDLSTDGVRELITQRWQGRRALEESDVEAFARDSRARRVDDVADALHHRLSGGQRVAHVAAPRGFVKRALSAMSDDEISQVARRLRGRGHSAEQIRRSVRKLDPSGRIGGSLGLTVEDENG